MKQYIKQYILDRLTELKGQAVDLDYLGSELYKTDMQARKITSFNGNTDQFIQDHKAEYANVIKYWNGRSLDMANAIKRVYFDKPERAMFYLVITYVDAVVSRFLSVRHCDFDWDCLFTVDQKFLDSWTNNLDSAIDEVFAQMDNLK